MTCRRCNEEDDCCENCFKEFETEKEYEHSEYYELHWKFIFF